MPAYRTCTPQPQRGSITRKDYDKAETKQDNKRSPEMARLSNTACEGYKQGL